MSLTLTQKMYPRPVWLRHLRRAEGLPLGYPSEHEIQDAIEIIRLYPEWLAFDERLEAAMFPSWEDSNRLAQRHYAELLLGEAERIHAECSI